MQEPNEQLWIEGEVGWVRMARGSIDVYYTVIIMSQIKDGLGSSVRGQTQLLHAHVT